MSHTAQPPTYSGHAAAARTRLCPTRKGRAAPRRRGRAGTPGGGTRGHWMFLGMLTGAAVIATACVLALAARGGVETNGSLISAVPSDAAFEAALTRTQELLGPYQPAGRASPAGDVATWDEEFVRAAVEPSLATLRDVTAPVHLRDSVGVVVRNLERTAAAVESLRECGGDGHECRTQKRALLDAVDDLYRTSGDLQLYTFG